MAPQQTKGSQLELDKSSLNKAVFEPLRTFTASEGFVHETCCGLMFVEQDAWSHRNS